MRRQSRLQTLLRLSLVVLFGALTGLTAAAPVDAQEIRQIPIQSATAQALGPVPGYKENIRTSHTTPLAGAVV